MALTSTTKLTQAFSAALEQRSAGYENIVSNANAIFYAMKANNMFVPFDGGPTIRERLLFAETGSYTRYSGYDFLRPTPREILNDAEFTPKQAAISVTLSGEELLQNSGRNQLVDLMDTEMKAAEQEMEDRFNEDLHSSGLLANQISGLQLTLPTTTDIGVYGGISRADHEIWRTRSYDVNGSDIDFDTQVDAESVRKIFEKICIDTSLRTRGPNMIAASQQHYLAYSEATVNIQRITDEGGKAGPGFVGLKFYGGGKSIDVTLEGGIGSAMPDNVSYFIDSRAMKLRYHSQRGFFKPMGPKQMPINQDAIVRHLGFYGELTMNNPRHMAKLLDSAPGS